MDRIWAYLGSMRDSLTGHLRFERLARVAKLVLTLPHSNADEEGVFSFIKINKTPVRNALNLNETLSSHLTIKMDPHIGPRLRLGPIWKCPCIKIFITYFRHLEKRPPYWPETIWKWSCSNPITVYFPGV